MSEDKKSKGLYRNQDTEEGDVKLDSRGYMVVETTSMPTPVTEDQEDQVSDQTGEKVDWKKRYSDLRSYSDKKLNKVVSEKEERISELEERLNSIEEAKDAKSDEEIDAFKARNPELAAIIESISAKKAQKLEETYQKELDKLLEEREEAQREKAIAKVSQTFPDWEDIKASDDFHNWLGEQPDAIQEWAYKSSDPDLAIRVIKLYKADKPTKKTSGRKPDASAAEEVKPSRKTEPTSGSNKKVWTVKEIEKLSPSAYEKHYDEIMLAVNEGRLTEQILRPTNKS